MNNRVVTIILYIVTLVAGVLVTLGIFLDSSPAKALTLGFGIGLYNGVIIHLIDRRNS